MHERIRMLRKVLDLTQQEFAARIGVKRNTIANYETGRNEPIDSVVSLICREFSVNESWLRTGEGEIFTPKAEDTLDALVEERGLSQETRIVLEKFLNLKPEIRDGIICYLVEVAEALNSNDAQTSTPAKNETQRGMTAEELHAELDRQINMEKDMEAKSEVS